MLGLVPPAAETAKRFLLGFRRHQLHAIDIAGLLIAEGIVGRFITHLPFLAAASVLAAESLIPSRSTPGATYRVQAFASRMPRRLVLLAATGFAWMYFWSLPARCLWLGPIWIGLVWIPSWNWRRIAGVSRLGASWIVRHGIEAAWARSAFAWIKRHRSPGVERLLRIILLVALPFWLMRGFIAPFLQGGGDAAWYGAVLADTMEQVRSGVFPIWAGQSAFQFNGAISPVRIAPAFNNFGALLDVATLHHLGPVALLNLMLTAVAVAATASTYVCLGALLQGRRWMAAGLTVLFVACPAVLGIAYNGDLYMSWMTLPLVPFVFLGMVLSFRPEHERRALLILGAALGLCWWAHAPIALWATLLASGAQAARVVARRGRNVRWRAMAEAALVFAAIAAYPIGSVLIYPPGTGQHLSEIQQASPGAIVYFTRDAFPGAILPMSAVGRTPGDVQLGYALWAMLLFCLCFRYRSARLEVQVLLVEAAILAVLVLPIPGISLQAWRVVPSFIRNPTGNWAAPRLYLPLAAATIFAMAAAQGGAEKTRRGLLISIFLGAGCVWSLLEASKFAGEARLIAREPMAMIDTLRPENLQLTRYSYGMFPRLPDTFTHGVTDPLLENRLLAKDSQAPILENADAALALGKLVSTARFVRGSGGQSGTVELDRPFVIEPGRSYLLQLAIARKGYAVGVLQIQGREFLRVYGLPEHGGPRSFGVGGSHLGVIPIWTTTGESESLMVRFFPSPPVSVDQALQFASEVRLLAYDRDALPVRVESWIPYSARVSSPAAALLETPRMYQPGYGALVDGKPAAVSQSPDGLVCVAVPAGESNVTVSYVPPAGLRALYWLSFLGIACSGAAAALAWLFGLVAARRAKGGAAGAGG
jgi:hypothetical protein